MKIISVLKFVKCNDVVEIQHNRHEGFKTSKFMAGTDIVKVLGTKGSCIMSDARCLAPSTAEVKVKNEASRLAKQGWALIVPASEAIAA